MTGRESRLAAARLAMASVPNAPELSDVEILRIHSRATRNPSPQRAMSIHELATKSRRRAPPL